MSFDERSHKLLANSVVESFGRLRVGIYRRERAAPSPTIYELLAASVLGRGQYIIPAIVGGMKDPCCDKKKGVRVESYR